MHGLQRRRLNSHLPESTNKQTETTIPIYRISLLSSLRRLTQKPNDDGSNAACVSRNVGLLGDWS